MAFRLGAESLAINMCPFRSTIRAGTYIQTPKSLHKKWVLNILNLTYDFCFHWRILGHIHIVDKHADELYKYKKYFNELDITGLQFPLKVSDTPKFENSNPTISVKMVYENNEFFPLYASKQRNRKRHVNLLMISTNEGKFHYLLVIILSTVVAGNIKHKCYTHVCLYCLYCYSEMRLFTAHLPDCFVHPEQKVE